MGLGKKAARMIDRRLMDREVPAIIPEFVYQMVPPDPPGASGRHESGELPAAARVQSYAEVSLGLTALAAREETTRCLRCDIRSSER
jgi:hypothetical protein